MWNLTKESASDGLSGSSYRATWKNSWNQRGRGQIIKKNSRKEGGMHYRRWRRRYLPRLWSGTPKLLLSRDICEILRAWHQSARYFSSTWFTMFEKEVLGPRSMLPGWMGWGIRCADSFLRSFAGWPPISSSLITDRTKWTLNVVYSVSTSMSRVTRRFAPKMPKIWRKMPDIRPTTILLENARNAQYLAFFLHLPRRKCPLLCPNKKLISHFLPKI